MAYLTGSSNSLDDLKNALLNGLQQANMGWVVDVGAGTASKNGIAARLEAITVGSPAYQYKRDILRLTVNDAPFGHCIGQINQQLIANPDAYVGITFPAVWHLHVNTNNDEVYFFVQYNVETYQWLAFGRSPAPGIPGTGVWAGGSMGVSTSGVIGGSSWPCINITVYTGGGGTNTYLCTALFWVTAFNYIISNSYTSTAIMHTGLNNQNAQSGANGWEVNLQAITAATTLVSQQPSAWNQESILIPIRPIQQRPDNRWSIVGDIHHCRYMRIDNHAPGEIITLGNDKWRVYPWFRKNAAARNGGSNIDHTGTFGCALRM